MACSHCGSKTQHKRSCPKAKKAPPAKTKAAAKKRPPTRQGEVVVFDTVTPNGLAALLVAEALKDVARAIRRKA